MKRLRRRLAIITEVKLAPVALIKQVQHKKSTLVGLF